MKLIRIVEIIVAALLFIFGYITRGWLEDNTNFFLESVQNSSEITTAITDRYELQVTDRTNGKVKIFEKDVLDAIYHQYQARRIYTQEEKKAVK